MKVSALLAFLTVVGLVDRIAEARLHRSWSYDQLTASAEVIVIVKPVATRATGAQAALPDITSMDANGKKSPVMAERVETELAVIATLKGTALDATGKPSSKIRLHHYREAPNKVSINGPGLVSFDPKAGTQYLMFLVRDKDGQYVAVSGQTDPDYSIEPLKMQKP